MLLLSVELIFYGGILILLSVPFRHYACTVSDAALGIRPLALFLWIVPSVSLSMYIVATYGFLALIPDASIASSAGLPSWLVYLNVFLLVPAWGAVYCCSVRFAHGRFHAVQLLAAVFVVSRMIFEAGAGKRYFLIVCMVAALFGRRRPYQINRRVIAGGLVAASLVFATWAWYEGVRRNLNMTLGRSYDSSFDMIGDVLTPSAENSAVDSIVTKELEQRTPPIWFLVQVVQLPDLSHGAFISQSIKNVLPNVFADVKRYQHENDVFADVFQFPYDDYPWTLMTEMNAEVSALSVVLTPLMYVGLFWLCWSLIDRWRDRSPTIVLATIGVAVFASGEVQTQLTVLGGWLRTMGIYVVIGFFFLHFRRFVSLTLSRMIHSDDYYPPSREEGSSQSEPHRS